MSANFRGQIGKYQIKDLIGEGGMGLVFKPEDIYLRRTVALKVMKPHVSSDNVAWKMFLNEARATAALQNPRIATVWEVDEVAGTMYLAMELLKGESLEARLQRGRLPLTEALGVVREAALGLEVAHETGFFHRDIKPANLWLTGLVDAGKSSETLQRCRQEVTGEAAASRVQGVKLLDFGLVRMERDSNGQMRRGRSSARRLHGHWNRRWAKWATPARPVQLGVVLYRLVTENCHSRRHLARTDDGSGHANARADGVRPVLPAAAGRPGRRLLSTTRLGALVVRLTWPRIRCVEVELANPRKVTGQVGQSALSDPGRERDIPRADSRLGLVHVPRQAQTDPNLIAAFAPTVPRPAPGHVQGGA